MPRRETDCAVALLPACRQGFTSKDLGGDGGHFAALPLAQYPLQVRQGLRQPCCSRTCRQQQHPQNKAQTLRRVRLVPQHSANPLKRGTSCPYGAAAITLLSVLLLLAAAVRLVWTC